VHRQVTIEIVIGQVQNPVVVSMLLGQKSIPGTPQAHAARRLISAPAYRHPDWTGQNDLTIKNPTTGELFDWGKPIYVKLTSHF